VCVCVCVCVHRVCQQQQPAGRNIPECVCSDGAVRAGGGGRVPAAAPEERLVTRGRCSGRTLSLHWKGLLSKVKSHQHSRVLMEISPEPSEVSGTL